MTKTYKPLALPGLAAAIYFAATGTHPWLELVALFVGFSFYVKVTR